MADLIALEKRSIFKGSGTAVQWTACKPFLENSMAVLIHRPRAVTTHKIGPRYAPHLGIELWCGNHMNGGKKFTFLSHPGRERIVCARCEAAAVAAGLPSSTQLAGEHVHLGGVIAVRHCCEEGGTR
jgi:hypothetical protein